MNGGTLYFDSVANGIWGSLSPKLRELGYKGNCDKAANGISMLITLSPEEGSIMIEEFSVEWYELDDNEEHKYAVIITGN
jgi:hypothetical protein